MSTQTPQLFLSLEISGISARVLLNGVVVQQFDQAEPVRAASRLSSWAVAGLNRFEINWKPQSVASGGARKLGVRVQRVIGEQDLEALRFDLPTGGTPTGSQTLTLDFQPDERWSWLNAQAFPSLPPNERSAIIAVLEQVRAAMVQGDSQALISAQTMQIGEQARANGGNSMAAINLYREFLGERLPMIVNPIAPEMLKFELMGEGRIVLVSGHGGHPAVFGRSTGGILAMSPYLAKIGGEWQIVR